MEHINHEVITTYTPRVKPLVSLVENKKAQQAEIDRLKEEYFARGGRSEFIPIIVREYKIPEYNGELSPKGQESRRQIAEKAFKQRLAQRSERVFAPGGVKLQDGLISRPEAIKYINDHSSLIMSKRRMMNMEARGIGPVPAQITKAEHGSEFRGYRIEDLAKWIAEYTGHEPQQKIIGAEPNPLVIPEPDSRPTPLDGGWPVTEN